MFGNRKKKTIVFVGLLFSLEAMFALSDASVLMNFYMSRTDYIDINSTLHREKVSPSMNLDFSNYNLLFVSDHIGFFEHVNFHFTDDFFMEFLLGPAIGVQLSPRFSIQGGPAFHCTIAFSESDVNNVTSLGRDFQRAVNLQIGVSNDIQLKIHIVKWFSAVAGFYFSIDFVRTENVLLDGNWFSLHSTDFKSFSLSPYLGVNFSF